MTRQNGPVESKPSVPTADDAKDALFRALKNSNDPHVRRFATFFIGQLKDTKEIVYLAALLRDPDKGVREQATKALAMSGKPGFALLSGLLNDPDWKVRYRASEALGLTRDPDAVPFLIGTLDDEKDHVRYMAAKSLGSIGERGAERPLIAKIDDENEFVRKMVAISLGNLGGLESEDALEKRIDNEPSKIVRGAIRESIRQIRRNVQI